MYLYCVLGQNFAKVLKLPTRVKIVLVDRYTNNKNECKIIEFYFHKYKGDTNKKRLGVY